MGNCCKSESKAQTQLEERIKKEHEREEAKRQLEEAIKNMANGQEEKGRDENDDVLLL